MSALVAKPSFYLAAETRALQDLLMKARPGDVVNYIVMTKLIGKKVGGAYRALQQAKRNLLRDHNVRYESVFGLGQKRLTDRDIVAASEKDIRKLHRAAAAGFRRLSAVQDYDTLDNDSKLRHTINATVMNFTVHATSEPVLERIGAGIGIAVRSTRELSISETLALFER